jgi:hypothetical protein
MKAEKCYETVEKTNIVIPQPAKNLIFFLFKSEDQKKRSVGFTASGRQEKTNLQKFWNSLTHFLPLILRS